MYRDSSKNIKFDWLTIFLFFVLVVFGWLNILSASHTSGGEINLFDFSQPYGKQLIFIFLDLILIILVLAIDAKFYERFSSIIYIIALVSLAGLFLFGKTVNGATAWYAFGNFTIQPGEFAKTATALAVAKYVSDFYTDISTIKDQFRVAIIIALPALLILLQNDTGSAVVYAAFFFVLYREGLPKLYLTALLILVLVSIATLKFGIVWACILSCTVLGIRYFTQKRKPIFLQPILIATACCAIAFGVRFFYQDILQAHQQDRINLWLRLEDDPAKLKLMKKREAYNLIQSEQAISSGGFSGKGFMEGTRTTGKFVPEQHTDYIFSTVGEEWGFIGTAGVVIVFVLLLLRVLHLAELQKSQFSRVFGYCVASIMFLHFMINIGMVMGLIPTIGIPLPFFSYGGSGLWGFTILLFVFIKLNANRANEW